MRADRLLSLLLFLQSKGSVTAQELADHLEVSERTIYRDVEALSLSGIPVYAQPGVSGGIFLDEDYRLTINGLSLSEIQSLFIPSTPGPLHDLGLGQASSNTLLKLLAALPARQRDEAERMRQRVYIDPTSWFRSVEETPYLSTLQKAVWEDLQVLTVYLRSDGASSERLLDPFSLVAKSSIWYLVARQPDGSMRTFRVSRFQHVSPVGAHFQRPSSFDLSTYWEKSIREFEQQTSDNDQPYPAVVRLDPDVVRSFIGDLAGRYSRLEEEDPQDWLHYWVVFSSSSTARMHILSYGNRIEALDPPDLRAWLGKTAQAIAERYRVPVGVGENDKPG